MRLGELRTKTREKDNKLNIKLNTYETIEPNENGYVELDLDMIDEHNIYFRVINRVEESYMKQKQRRCKECSYYMYKRANQYNDESVPVCGKNGKEITNLYLLLTECEVLNDKE